MRKLLISILLASAAASPALAAREPDRQEAREDRQQVREERQQARQERRQESRSERPQVQRAERVERVQRAQPPMQVRQQSFDRNVRVQTIDRRDDRQQVFRDRRDDRRQATEARRDNRAQERAEFQRDRMRTPVVSNTPRPGTQPPPPRNDHRTSTPSWNSNWHHDGRYDWRKHRNRHRSLFHLGFYYDPFGWGYQPYSIGWRLWPSYYSSRYWINDPWQYRLPYAPPGYRWIRYWDDAILVDTWTGQVVDVVYNFFW